MNVEVHRDIPKPPPFPESDEVVDLDENDFILENEGDDSEVAHRMVDFAKGEMYDFRVQGRDGLIKAAEAIGVAPEIEMFEELEHLNLEGQEALGVLEGALAPEPLEEEPPFTGVELKIYNSFLRNDIDPQVASQIIHDAQKALLDTRFVEELETTCEKYGFQYENLDANNKNILGTFYFGAHTKGFSSEIESMFQERLKEILTLQALTKLDTVNSEISAEKIEDVEVLKVKIKEVLTSLQSMAEQLPAEDEKNAKLWDTLLGRFHVLVSKKGKMGEQFQQAFSEIFSEFSGFIEDELLEAEAQRRTAKGDTIVYEQLMKEFYGRTKEEMEKIKAENRKQVVEEITRMSNEEHSISIAMIEKLHALNNRNIVPKKVSKIRPEDDYSITTFGKRMGILGLDVKKEMDAFIQRVDNLVDKNVSKNLSKARFEIAAAQLHNELLDMHPFADRNGSTSLLFLELLMTKHGYKPSPKREKNYYFHLQKILGSNPIAVSVVAAQHLKIQFKPGYFEGVIPKSPELKSIYADSLEAQRLVRQKKKEKNKTN